MKPSYLITGLRVGATTAAALIAAAALAAPTHAALSTPSPTAGPGTVASTAVISSLNANELLNHAGEFKVQEYFTVAPGANPPASVTQRIPVSITDDQGNNLVSTFKILSASVDGHAVNLQNAGNGTLTSITFPLSGSSTPQKFAFQYSLTPIILAGDTADILKVSATGLDWSLPLQASTILLTTPGLAPQDLTCYTGVSGSTTSNCRITPTGPGANLIITDAALASGASLELYAGFPRHSFLAYYNSWHVGLLLPWAIGAGIVLILIIALAVMAGRRRHRRNAKSAEHSSAQS